MRIINTEADGVPVLWAASEGQREAGLVFRVGRADEALARSGLTHLIEHLVLYGIDNTDYHFNGVTDRTTTTFVTRGNDVDICRFFASVCDGLRHLPADRLEIEKSVLRTEASSRPSGVVQPLTTWRYGPTGYGLSAYPELGLPGLTIDDLQAWSAQWFVRGNAALWLVGGPPPAALRLDLPDGPRRPLPQARTVLPRLPAYFAHHINGVAFSGVVHRGAPARAYAAVVDRRLRALLRTELGLSYTTAALIEPRDRDFAEVTAMGDALPDKRGRLVAPFVDVLTDMALGGCTPAELDNVRSVAEGELTRSGAIPALLQAAAEDLLVGAAETSLAKSRDDLARVTSDDVTAVAREALATGLIMVPRGQAVGRAGFTQAPSTSATRVSGREYPLIDASADDRRRLIIGPNGVSLVDGPKAATVHFEECVAVAAYPDGARVLFAPDAIVVTMEPTLWGLGAEDIKLIDTRVPTDRVAHQPPRPSDQIPQPAPAAATRDSTSQPAKDGSATTPSASGFRTRPLTRHLGTVGVALVVVGTAALATLAVVQGKSVVTFLGIGVLAAVIVNTIRKHTNS